MGDLQSGHERTLTGLIPALAGTSLIFGAGLSETGIGVDASLLVADNEFVSMFRHVCRGIPVTDSTLMIDEIVELGPEAEYLSAQSTLERARAISAPKFMDRNSREDWGSAGGADMYERCRSEAKRILAECSVDPLPQEISQKLDGIVSAADYQYAHVTH